MPINHDLINRIKTSLGATISPSLKASSSLADLYEAFVFGLVITAAKSEGATVKFFDTGGTVPPIFRFRTSPGSIWLPNYSYAKILFQGKPALESHIGVYMCGRSGVRHECDVSVIRRTEAETCRQNQVHPRQNKSEMAAECKMYRQSRLGIDLGRSFIGLSVDLSGMECTFVASRNASNIERLLDKHKKNHGLSAIPTNHLRVNQLKTWFEGVFRAFKTAN